VSTLCCIPKRAYLAAPLNVHKPKAFTLRGLNFDPDLIEADSMTSLAVYRLVRRSRSAFVRTLYYPSPPPTPCNSCIPIISEYYKIFCRDVHFGRLIHDKFHSHQCNVSPRRGERPHNRPLCNINTGVCGSRNMPVMNKNARVAVFVDCVKGTSSEHTIRDENE